MVLDRIAETVDQGDRGLSAVTNLSRPVVAVQDMPFLSVLCDISQRTSPNDLRVFVEEVACFC